jgi:predicted esterase YcpF (UPF0227 family)
MKNPTIIYFHGYASTGHTKSDMLKERFSNVISPVLPLDLYTAELVVGEIISSIKDYPIVFVGTSLGGFVANYFANLYDIPAVLINPAINPSSSLIAHNDPRFTPSVSCYYKECEEFISKNYNGALISLFLAKDDKLFNYKDTLKAFPYTSATKVYENGGHRFLTNFDKVILFLADKYLYEK